MEDDKVTFRSIPPPTPESEAAREELLSKGWTHAMEATPIQETDKLSVHELLKVLSLVAAGKELDPYTSALLKHPNVRFSFSGNFSDEDATKCMEMVLDELKHDINSKIIRLSDPEVDEETNTLHVKVEVKAPVEHLKTTVSLKDKD